MSFLEQLSSYLSQSPNSIVYHIVMLLALQATLGLAWWQARRHRQDAFARRLAWAAGLILLTKLGIVVAYFATSGLVEAVALLPPLERATDALAVALLVWALAPRARNLPFLNTALLLILVIVISIVFVAFTVQWQSTIESVASGEGYLGTPQAAIWSILEMVLLTIGAALVIIARESQWSLRLALLVVLFVAQGMSLLFGSTYGPPNVTVSFWARLGNIIAFPMLAVLAYRHNLRSLLPADQVDQTTGRQLAECLDLASETLGSSEVVQTVEDGLTLVSALLPVQLVAIVQIIHERPQHLHITARSVQAEEERGNSMPASRDWVLKREDWPNLRMVLEEERQVDLTPDAPGARQLRALQEEFQIGREAAVLIQPLMSDERQIGLLLLASRDNRSTWSEDQKTLVESLGRFLAQALDNAQRYQLALSGHARDFEHERATLRSELEETVREREAALDRAALLDDQLAVARERHDANQRKLRQTSQAVALAVQRQSRIQQLEKELAGLREALSEAELALAYAAAGDAGLSTEWVMRTVTRYSGELEEAQAHIGNLEERLNQPDELELVREAVDISGHLRSPLTALSGYTDMLLEKTIGEVSPQQESLLRRIKESVDSMTETIDALSAVTLVGKNGQGSDRQVDVHEAIEDAAHAVSHELQAKRLRVNIYIEDDLPALTDLDDAFQTLLVELLTIACQVSMTGGRLRVRVKCIPCDRDMDLALEFSTILHVSISDDAGKHSHDLYAKTLVSQGEVTAVPVDMADILHSAMRRANAHGGRCWIDVASEDGSTLSLLWPLPAASSEPGD